MKSTLIIKDLSLDSQLGQAEMSAVRGGQGDQANGTSQSNMLAGLASSNIANGSIFAGSGPVSIQGDSKVDQTGTNYNDSVNFKGLFVLPMRAPC